MLWNKWQGVILRFKKCQIWQKKLRLEIKKIVRFERCQRRELELQTSQLLWRWYSYDEKNGDDDDDANNDDENNDDEFDRKMWLGWRSSWKKWSWELKPGRARRERSICNIYDDHDYKYENYDHEDDDDNDDIGEGRGVWKTGWSCVICGRPQSPIWRHPGKG